MSDEAPGDDGYSGPAELLTSDESPSVQVVLPVQVVLRGQVDTIAGSYHWYGRVAADPAVDALAARLGRRGTVTLRTPAGEAATALAEPDTWGRYRVEGRGHAPFAVLADLPDDLIDDETGEPPGDRP